MMPNFTSKNFLLFPLDGRQRPGYPKTGGRGKKKGFLSEYSANEKTLILPPEKDRPESGIFLSDF
jgi:hypothetical protein